MQRTKRVFIKIAWILGALVLLWTIIRLFFTSPLLDDISFSRAYYDRNGTLLRLTLSADDKYRVYTPLSEISPYIKQAIVLYEDKHFYNHPGINPVALFRALGQYTSGTVHPVGASTITMQVARLKYNINSKTVGGKLAQIAAAIYIDMFHSKDEILEAYLNLAPYGGNIEGIGAASTIYFGRHAKDLTKIESITLATIPQNPTKRGLNTATGIANIENMRSNLVERWIAENPNDINLRTLAAMPLQTRKVSDLPFLAPHFIDNLNTRKMPPKMSEIYTTLDMALQSKLETTLRGEINARKSIGITNAAAILVNYKTMETLAYIGSADYHNRDIFGENDGVRARRSPGSTLKPLIYATATDRGIIHGMTLLRDTRVNFGVYAPENSDNEFYGPILARDALTRSRNIPAINLVREIGINDFYKILSESGVTALKSPIHYGVSVALGGAEVSMFELSDIYATMANLGTRKQIKMLRDTRDKEITHLLSPEAFFLTLDMLSHQSTPTKAIPFAKNQKSSLRHYWKTGTSSSYRDAWTAGIFGDFVLIVWVGNFDGHPNNAFSGARAAAPIYFELANTVTDYYDSIGTKVQNNNFMNDDLNVISVDMCVVGGGIAGPYCPQREKSYFIPGKSPITRNTVHRMIPIDNKTGLRACKPDAENTHNAIYEFWDTEYLDLFKRAGIKRNTPPQFMPDCDINEISDDTVAPVIIYPIADTKIVITSENNFEPIGFTGLGATPDSKLIWFMDDKILGTTHNGETLQYNVQIGEHHITVTDTNGTTTDMVFSVVK
ncbi:MAG: penicillin-binding protein 1C [Alphaproteobacteria bacterium]|nr:penicillin-binding protein 1C [Alphaproteobacteria bacterium]